MYAFGEGEVPGPGYDEERPCCKVYVRLAMSVHHEVCRVEFS